VSGDRGARGQGTADDDDNTAITQEQQQHEGWRTTYLEHVPHVRYRAHVPIADGLIEISGILQRGEGRVAVWSERRSRSEGTGDDTATLQQQQDAGWGDTYAEHPRHVQHRPHVPSTDGLIESASILHCNKGRMAV